MVLPKIISREQSGFVPGRSIVENILMAHEVTHNLNNKHRSGNVIMKLDMEKAYDRIEWFFITSVMRRLGFPEIWIDRVWQLVSNCWFSIIINGSSSGFFKSSRGIRQGDPLSPGLFILAAEALSCGLDDLLKKKNFKPYRMPKGCLPVTHLSLSLIHISEPTRRS